VVFWVSASLEVEAAEVARTASFWSAVTGSALPAHLDLGTTDREAETVRHRALGASVVTREEFWTVLTDPAGLAYCITDRDPATGELG
jgi:hypothetical protein